MVGISPNLKREKVFIDINGNEVKPFTKEVIKAADKAYVPTREEMEAAATKKPKTEEELKKEREEIKTTTSPQPMNIEALISKKIEAIIEKKIADVLEKMLK